MPEPSLRGRAEWFIVGVFALGAMAFTAAFFVRPIDDPAGVLALVTLTALSERLGVKLYFDGRVSISFVGAVMAAVCFGAPAAALVAAAIALTGGYLFADRSTRKLAFNFGQQNMAAFAAAMAIAGVAATGIEQNPLALVAEGAIAGLVIFAVTTTAVAGVVSITTSRNFFATHRADFAWLLPHYVALGLVAGALSAVYGQLGVAGLVALTIPLLLSRYSIKQVVDKTRDNVLRLEKSNQQLRSAYIEIRDMSEELRDAYTGTLESLVAALDMRDQETRGHSNRVANHSVELARLLGLNDEEELTMIYRGALMHDVGKIGVPDAILRKPGPLTDDEWLFMRKHPTMGYRILAQVPYLRPAARVVLAHHERWDGDGYPRRLKGEAIPLGARIFALADTYDAIVSDRPYRDGKSPDEALKEILRCAGSQFDPKVVEAFEAVFPGWRDEKDGHGASPLYLPAWRRRDDAPGRATG